MGCFPVDSEEVQRPLGTKSGNAPLSYGHDAGCHLSPLLTMRCKTVTHLIQQRCTPQSEIIAKLILKTIF